MKQIARWICDVLAQPENAELHARVHGSVRELCEQFPAPTEAGR